MFNKCDSSCESRNFFFASLLLRFARLFVPSFFFFGFLLVWKMMGTKRWRRRKIKTTNSNEKNMKKTDHWNRSSVCRVEKERRRDLIKTASFFVMLHEDVLLTDHFSQSGFHCAWGFIFHYRKGYDNCYGNIQMNNFYLFVPILRSLGAIPSLSLYHSQSSV